MTEDKSNGSKGISDIVPQTELNVSESKATRFAMEYLNCRDVREAGRRAGYSESVRSSGYLYGKFRNPKFQEIFRSVAIALDYQDLAFIYSLERGALREAVKQAKDEPESALENIAKLKQVSKQKKQIIGILGQDTPQLPQTINVALIERINVVMTDMLQKRALGFKEE